VLREGADQTTWSWSSACKRNQSISFHNMFSAICMSNLHSNYSVVAMVMLYDVFVVAYHTVVLFLSCTTLCSAVNGLLNWTLLHALTFLTCWTGQLHWMGQCHWTLLHRVHERISNINAMPRTLHGYLMSFPEWSAHRLWEVTYLCDLSVKVILIKHKPVQSGINLYHCMHTHSYVATLWSGAIEQKQFP